MILFRKAKKGDEEQLLKLVQQVLKDYQLELEHEGADLDITDIEKFYTNNKGWFQVVEKKGKIIGSVGIYRIDNEACELRKMYLDKIFQGQGIGKKLMENALVEAKKLQYKAMTLQTNSVLVKALPLYEKYGFVKECSEEVCSRCDIAMRKELV